MKTLAVICTLVACCAAHPGFAYDSYTSVLGLGQFNPSFYSTPGLLPYSQYLSTPALTAPLAKSVIAPGVAATPALVTKSVAVPAVATAHVVAAVPAVATPAVTKTQWHAQTELGQASYGHSEPLQAHSAHQDAHGNKVGSYSYVNPQDGQVHRTDYVADALGYRVVANDLPVDTPAVALAKSAHLAAHVRSKRGLGYSVATPYSLATHYSLATPYNVATTSLNYAAVPAQYSAVQTTIVNNPGHAVSYRVD